MKLKRIISALSAAVLMLGCASLPASALKERTVINVNKVNITVSSTSSLYCGLITENGEPRYRYLWPDDIEYSSTVYAAVRDALSNVDGGVYADALSKYYLDNCEEVEDRSVKGIWVNMNNIHYGTEKPDWTSAKLAAADCYSEPVIKSSTDGNLYNINEGFAASCHKMVKDSGADESEIVDEAGKTFIVDCPLGVTASVATDSVTYTVIDGELVKIIDRTLDYYCEGVRVYYTAADVKPSSNSTLTVAENIIREPKVYVGKFSTPEGSTVKYVWSDDMTVNEDTITALRTALAGMEDKDYSALVPEAVLDQETGKYNYDKVAFCSDPAMQALMDSDWSSADAAGKKCFPELYATSPETAELYDKDAGFAAAVDALDARRKDGIDNPVDAGKRIITHLDSRSFTDVYYTLEDGRVVRHSDITVFHDSEALTVICTKAEMTEEALSLRGDVDGNGKLNMKDLATLQRYVNGWDVKINEKNADLTGDKKINMKDVAELQKLLNSLPA